MYSPTMRLLAVLELLETYSSMSGTELSRRLEVEVRTVRRYIATLQDMGIPVAADRGPYGGYRLRRGSRLPPLMFNDSEAAAVMIGLRTIRQLSFPIDAAAVEGAIAKTERLLPEKLLNHVQTLQGLLTVRTPSFFSTTQLTHGQFAELLDGAIRKQRSVLLTYSARNGTRTIRHADLYGITWIEGYWYTAGYCHLRKDLRTFRVDRIHRLEATDLEFLRPPEFDLSRFVLESIDTASTAIDVEVVLQATLEQARTLLPFEVSDLESADDGVVYRLSTNQLEGTALNLLGLKVPFRIRKPPELRDVILRISEQAAQVVAMN